MCAFRKNYTHLNGIYYIEYVVSYTNRKADKWYMDRYRLIEYKWEREKKEREKRGRERSSERESEPEREW